MNTHVNAEASRLAGLLPVPLHASGVNCPELPAPGGPVLPGVMFVMARKHSLKTHGPGYLAPTRLCLWEEDTRYSTRGVEVVGLSVASLPD